MAETEVNLPDPTLDQLRQMLMAAGVNRLLVKELSPNDNSKNQMYLSGSLDVTNILPVGPIEVDATESGNRIMKALLPLSWLQADGTIQAAPNSKLILYPQYPEVRFSGFLLGARNAPSFLMRTRMPGRLLFFGITLQQTIVAWVAGPGSRIAAEMAALTNLEQVGVFRKVPLQRQAVSTRDQLLAELRRIHLLDWIDSKSLARNGSIAPCNSTNCVGYTLEAELGVSRNGFSEPDFLGWEIKASQLDNYNRPPAGKALTLFTPEPTGGFYRSEGVPEFIRKFGYCDLRGREDRMNFGGTFRVGHRHERTALTLKIRGFDVEQHQITDPTGTLFLESDSGEIAAEWSFPALLDIWNRKHAQAAYVPAEVRASPGRQYRYGQTIRLGEGTSFSRLIEALAGGQIYYDLGIKLEGVSTASPRAKRRSQFRIHYGDLAMLYDRMTAVSILDPAAGA